MDYEFYLKLSGFIVICIVAFFCIFVCIGSIIESKKRIDEIDLRIKLLKKQENEVNNKDYVE